MMTKRYLLFLSLLFLLAGCGFHIQRGMELAPPLQRLKLQTPDPYGVLARSLQQYLRASHITLVDNLNDATTVLVILSDNNYQDLISVSSTQQTRQFNLRVVVTFQILDRLGRTLVGPQSVTESRVITIQSNQILGTSNEANLFYQQMRRTVAAAIMNRLASAEITAQVNREYKQLRALDGSR